MHENIATCPLCGCDDFDITELTNPINGVEYGNITAYVCNNCKRIFESPTHTWVTDEE